MIDEDGEGGRPVGCTLAALCWSGRLDRRKPRRRRRRACAKLAGIKPSERHPHVRLAQSRLRTMSSSGRGWTVCQVSEQLAGWPTSRRLSGICRQTWIKQPANSKTVRHGGRHGISSMSDEINI